MAKKTITPENLKKLQDGKKKYDDDKKRLKQDEIEEEKKKNQRVKATGKTRTT